MLSKIATPSKQAIASTSTLVLAANAGRTGLILTNDSDTVLYLGFGGAAVINKGFRMNASGGAYEMNETNLYTGAIYAITAAGENKNLCFIEFTQ